MRLAPLALALCLPLSADGLGTLRANLQKLSGGDAVKATVDHSFWEQTTEDKKPVQTQGRVSVLVEDGAQGLRLGWGRPLLQQAVQEGRAKAKDPEKTTGTRSALRAIDALEASELVNYAEPLLRHLENAQLLEEKSDSWQGQPAHLLLLKVEPKMSASQKKHLKKLDVVAKVWVGADGLPLAASTTTSFSGSFFLISFQGSSKEEDRFLHAGSRLVVVSRLKEESSSGFGQNSSSKKQTAVSLN